MTNKSSGSGGKLDRSIPTNIEMKITVTIPDASLRLDSNAVLA
jgi:hypothetical protein